MNKQLYIKTFGCQMNERDSEIVSQLLAQDGYQPVDTPEEAGLILLNTCTIRAKAEQKVFSMLGQMREVKKSQPDLLVGVIGCVAQQEGKEIFRRMPHVNLVVGTQQIYQIPEMLDRLHAGTTKREISTDLSAEFEIPPFHKLLHRQDVQKQAPAISTEFRRFVTIMQGCNNFCSYCVVPATRGREISRPVVDLLEEVQTLVDQGVKEITLLGQNVNSYGQTNAVAQEPVNFSMLLRQVAAIEGIRRLRFTTSNPKDLSDELMACFADLPQLCSHFHLPVQSGSNTILKAMNRKYTVEEYLEKVAALREYRPGIALATDMIIGFPGETDQDFQQTMDLLHTVRFHSSFSFKYSDRPGTRSVDLPNKVDEAVKSERLQVFQAAQDQICLERNQESMGKDVEIMVESVQEGDTPSMKGRTSANQIVHVSAPSVSLDHPFHHVPGDLCTVHITHAGKHSLQGELKSS